MPFLKGKNHPFYKNGKSRNQKLYRGLILTGNDSCQLCGKKGRLVVHHIDKNHLNNKKNNLQILCYKCHSIIHFKKTFTKEEYRNKIKEYYIKHNKSILCKYKIPKSYITASEVCNILNITRQYVSILVKTNKIKYKKIIRKKVNGYIFPKKQFEVYLNNA